MRVLYMIVAFVHNIHFKMYITAVYFCNVTLFRLQNPNLDIKYITMLCYIAILNCLHGLHG